MAKKVSIRAEKIYLMKEKIVLSLAGLPSMGNHGGAQTCYGIIKALSNQYDISVISFYEKSNQYIKDKKK